MDRRTQFVIGSAIGVAATLVFRQWQNRVRLERETLRLDDQVEVASDDSFPASDPPSYTPTSASRPAMQ
jgi:hypothetical protein